MADGDRINWLTKMVISSYDYEQPHLSFVWDKGTIFEHGRVDDLEHWGSVADRVKKPLRMVTGQSREELLDCMGNEPRFVVSTALKSVIETFRIPNTDFYPVAIAVDQPEEVTIYFPVKEPLASAVYVHGYWLMHCFNHLDILDIEKTDARWFGQEDDDFTSYPVEKRKRLAQSWNEIVLTEPSIADDLYRIKGWNNALFVSTRLYRALKESGLRGFEFLNQPLTPTKRIGTHYFYGTNELLRPAKA